MTAAQMIPAPDTIKNNRLYIALEPANKKWKISFDNGFEIRLKSIDAGDTQQFELELLKSKKHFGMPEDIPTYCCYEAGRDGFWSGNRRVRALMIELAWSWLFYQPRSKITQWFMERYGKGRKRMRRVGIVAVAKPYSGNSPLFMPNG